MNHEGAVCCAETTYVPNLTSHTIFFIPTLPRVGSAQPGVHQVPCHGVFVLYRLIIPYPSQGTPGLPNSSCPRLSEGRSVNTLQSASAVPPTLGRVVPRLVGLFLALSLIVGSCIAPHFQLALSTRISLLTGSFGWFSTGYFLGGLPEFLSSCLLRGHSALHVLKSFVPTHHSQPPPLHFITSSTPVLIVASAGRLALWLPRWALPSNGEHL